MIVKFKQADLSDEKNQPIILRLLERFSAESSHTQPLPPETHATLVENLRQHPTTVVYFVEEASVPIGIAVCFWGFSTFANKPLLNIHDLFIEREFRGFGIGKRFLRFIEDQAKENGCCKVTLEVYQNNERANIIYESLGYTGGRKETPENTLYYLSKKI
jgi:GNAT superfamily N-acetyltransferase